MFLNILLEFWSPEEHPLRIFGEIRGTAARAADLLDGLHPHGLAVGAVLHLEVHVELGRDELVDRDARRLHDGLLQPDRRLAEVEVQAAQEVQVQVGDGDADLLVVDPLRDVNVEVSRDLRRVGDEELAAGDRRRLEADERAVPVIRQERLV